MASLTAGGVTFVFGENMMKSLVLLSGGVDSTVVLYSLVGVHNIEAVTIDYGQRHIKEIESASKICEKLGVSHSTIVTHGWAVKSSLCGQSEVPDADSPQEGTVVPNRNMVMIAVAGSIAMQRKCDYLYVGCNADDFNDYPDCRPDFMLHMRKALLLASDGSVCLQSPLIGMGKREVIAYGKLLGVPFDDTWSCYNGKDVPCGVCAPCVSRISNGLAW